MSYLGRQGSQEAEAAETAEAAEAEVRDFDVVTKGLPKVIDFSLI